MYKKKEKLRDSPLTDQIKTELTKESSTTCSYIRATWGCLVDEVCVTVCVCELDNLFMRLSSWLAKRHLGYPSAAG